MMVGFTKVEALDAMNAVKEMFRGLAVPKQCMYLGHLNDILLFLGAAHRAAPEHQEVSPLPTSTGSADGSAKADTP